MFSHGFPYEKPHRPRARLPGALPLKKVRVPQDVGTRKDVGEIAWILVKAGEANIVIPSVSPEENVPRLSVARAILGPPERQVIVKVPFEDERAEAKLTSEARQLPPRQCGFVMVDVTAAPTAWESWPKLIPPRFTSSRHTRVGGVLLFSVPMMTTAEGFRRVPFLKLIPNPHARIALPGWLTDRIDDLRGEYRRLTSPQP